MRGDANAPDLRSAHKKLVLSVLTVKHAVYHDDWRITQAMRIIQLPFVSCNRHVSGCCRLCSLFVSDGCSFLAALLFAVHPIHTEAVSIQQTRVPTLNYIFTRRKKATHLHKHNLQEPKS